MKKHQIKGILAVLVVALVLGLATSGFSESEWRIESVTLSVGKEFGSPVPELFGEKDWVNDINQAMQDYETFVVDELGGDVTTKMAKEPPGAWNFGAGVQVQTPWAFKLRARGTFARTKANWSQNAIYQGVLDQEIRTELERNFDPLHEIQTRQEGNLRVSTWNISLGPEWTWRCPWWWDLRFYCGASALLGEILFGEGLEIDVEGDFVYDFTSDARLEGSGVGWQASVEIQPNFEFVTPSLQKLVFVGGVGYASRKELKVKGNMTRKESGEVIEIKPKRATLDTGGWDLEMRVEYPF